MSTKLRELQRKDRDVLEIMLSEIPSFDEEDQAIALELIDIALNDPEQKDYLLSLAVDENDRPLGYACYGPTPLTDGTFDLYWIAVDHNLTSKGIGTLLLKAVEDDIRKRHGRMLIIETSSSQEYDKTRQFYLKNNYPLVETIKDFYRTGEDRVTFIKRFID
ncbi:MAG: GNAT family N-acetyltransferase [Anaerolineaceae bacterium]